MRNVRRRQWWLLALSGLALLIAGLLGRAFLTALTTASGAIADNGNLVSSSNDCTSTRHGPSFGGTVIVDTNEVECGNLTTFGGTVAISGEVRGDVVAFNSDMSRVRPLPCLPPYAGFITPARDIGSMGAGTASADSESSQAARDELERSLAATLCFLFLKRARSIALSHSKAFFVSFSARLRNSFAASRSRVLPT